jgi:hypothetical protein
MKKFFLLVSAILVVSFSLAGCATTTPIVSEWRNPAYASGSFKRIMIGGPGGESVRRNFEDEFVVQLRSRGVEALPSYRYIADDEKVDETKLKQAAQKAGADAAILAKPIQREEKSQWVPGVFPYTSFGVFGSHFGASWHGFGGAPSVYRYNEYVSEATLYDVAKNEVVWAGTMRTTDRENVQAAIKSYVGAVIKALGEKKLIRTAE